jgi:hypothetical protein
MMKPADVGPLNNGVPFDAATISRARHFAGCFGSPGHMLNVPRWPAALRRWRRNCHRGSVATFADSRKSWVRSWATMRRLDADSMTRSITSGPATCTRMARSSRPTSTTSRDLAIARHFIEEHADRKHLRPTSPGVLVLGHNHAARRPGTTRTLLERAGFTILGAGVFTDDIGRDDKLRTDRVFRVGQTTPIHLVDALPQFVRAVAVRTRGTVFERLTHDRVSSLADLYEIVVVARTIPRPCPRS